MGLVARKNQELMFVFDMPGAGVDDEDIGKVELAAKALGKYWLLKGLPGILPLWNSTGPKENGGLSMQ